MALSIPISHPKERGIRSDFVSPKGLWAAVELYLVVTGYNTRFVSQAEAPRSYGDLLNQKWAGAISLDQTDEDWLTCWPMSGESKKPPTMWPVS